MRSQGQLAGLQVQAVGYLQVVLTRRPPSGPWGGPQGSIKLFWGEGCRGDNCQAQRLVAQVSAPGG